MKALKVVFCCIVASCMWSAAALADQQYPTTIIASAGAPVTLTACQAWARDFNKTILTAHASIPNARFDLGVTLANGSDKTVTAVRVMVTSYDSFNAVIASAAIDSQQNPSASAMAIAPGESLDLLGPKSWFLKCAPKSRPRLMRAYGRALW